VTSNSKDKFNIFLNNSIATMKINRKVITTMGPRVSTQLKEKTILMMRTRTTRKMMMKKKCLMPKMLSLTISLMSKEF
jgi:hypothetical protein